VTPPAAADGASRHRRPADPRVALPAAERLRVNEIFYSLQGESTYSGRPCVLVRLTGCQMRCVWCDSEHSFYDGTWRTVAEVLDAVAAFGCPLVEVTGGEPLLQPGVHPLMAALCEHGHEVLLETGGGLDIAPVDPRVRRIVDVKCPASGEVAHNRWANLALLRPTDELKFVLADAADYVWARDEVRRRDLSRLCPVLFSVVHGAFDLRALAERVLADRLPVRVQTQLHKLIWGADARGV
jgi:7-carboxy-7-deazaguanine synthase